MANENYEMADGSPRYGLRTSETSAMTPVRAAARGSATRIVERAATFDAVQLRTAVDYRYTLERFEADATLIEALRACNPSELKEAENIVKHRLKSPSGWLRGAIRIHDEELVSSGTTDDINQLTRYAAGIASLLLTVVPLLVWIGAKAAKLDDLTAIALLVVSMVGAMPFQKRLRRKMGGMLPMRLDAIEMKMLWADVVNATLVAVMQENGKNADSATQMAACRGWNHTSYSAARVRELAGNLGSSE